MSAAEPPVPPRAGASAAGPHPPGTTPAAAPPPGGRAWRRRLGVEVWIVLGLSLGRSGVYAVVTLLDRLTREQALGAQTATLNASRSERPWLDLTLQLLSIAFALVPVALALYLLSASGRSALRRIGLDRARPGRDLAVGVGLAAVIGLPGLLLYAVGRALGLTVEVQAAALDAAWWTVPVLVLAALQNALLEEVVAVAYLLERLRELRWGAPAVVVTSALLRGSYHLYQGWGAFVGNVVMGLVFAEWYRRRRRVAPLVVAHTLMDVVAFVGYALVPDDVRSDLGLS
ncbi:CPBP family intramembrane glutamic endopeptidase [Cellulomonas endophytica]|uniref:CPBP family intramembrane glutamic endopeptidase n=1 Tax=Cellulomonas endophytica TaxID=2494735 RepID=UPI001013B016